MKEWEEEGRVKEKGNSNNNNRQKIRDKERKKERKRTEKQCLQSLLLQASVVTQCIPTC